MSKGAMMRDGHRDKRWSRRQILAGSAGLTAAVTLGGALWNCETMGEVDETGRADESVAPRPPDLSDWRAVRAQFDASPQWVHMAAMLLATHPEPVRRALATHRQGLNENPVHHVIEHRVGGAQTLEDDAEERAMRAAGRYLEVDAANVALMGNTTEGLAMVYNGLAIDADQEVLTGHWNHWATQGSLTYSSAKRGFSIRRAHLYDDLSSVTSDELVDPLIDEIRPETRVVAVTWVHSVTGLKLPVGRIGERIAELNTDRGRDDQIIYCVDAVHGFGVENAEFADLSCHFYIAGCHKWLFGPRGTGVVVADPQAWQFVTPTVPTFSTHETPGRRFTPGGFHAFEHRWALAEAFDFHLAIGKDRVQDRIHDLAGHLIEELHGMPHVELVTPTESDLSSGVVVFRIPGHTTAAVVEYLRERGIVASSTPESPRLPRLSPGLLNDHREIAQTLAELRKLR